MADIYKSAWVILAATSSSDCALGFLNHREGTEVIEPHTKNGIRAKVRRTIVHNDGCYAPRGSPLFERAWAMQERELARRIIYFLPDEIVWRCRKKIECECGNEANFAYNITINTPILGHLESETDQLWSWGFAGDWNYLVGQYLGLKLTHETDLLPALSGIAKHIQDVNRPGKYIAGLWEQDIAIQLCWRRDYGNREFRVKQDKIAHAPTFSWTAASCPISWNPDAFVYDRPVVRSTLICSKAIPTTANPYGPARDCAITLRGPVLHGVRLIQCIKDARSSRDMDVFLDSEPDQSAPEHRPMFELQRTRARHEQALESLAESTTSEIEVIALQLYDRNEPDCIVTFVLLLQRRVREAHYTRLGVLECGDPKWFEEEGQERTVTIK